MQKHQVRTPNQALAYITDCNLATVQDMAMKKSRGKREFERQINIAQTACDWMRQMNIDVTGTRAKEVFKFNGSVSDWIKPYIA